MNVRSKGKRGELQWRDWLRTKLGLVDARRGMQFSGGPDSPDVVGGIAGTHCEVKRVEKFDPVKWINQAVRDAAGKTVPYVAHRQNNAPWLITIRADDLLSFYEVLNEFFTTGKGAGIRGSVDQRLSSPRSFVSGGEGGP